MARLDSHERSEAAAERDLLEAIGRACGKLGHDFNNIFASFRGCVDLLQGKAKKLGDPTALDRELDIMRRALRRGEALTAEMRAFARPGEPACAPTPVGELLGNVQRMFADLDLKDVSICVEGSCSQPVHVHSPTIVQMLVNILVNSADAMEKLPERTIVVCVDEVEFPTSQEGAIDAGRYCRLAFIDHGVGLSREAQARAFELFAKSRRVGVGRGLGLNLAMARLTMQKHRGAIQLHSLPEVGTQVQLLFPLQPG